MKDIGISKKVMMPIAYSDMSGIDAFAKNSNDTMRKAIKNSDYEPPK